MIYVLSGLGADERVFKYIDFGSVAVQHVKWMDPKGATSVNEYASVLRQQITHPKPILIGLSFGGMLAVEISKIIATEKLILIATAKNKYELPLHYRFGPSWMVPDRFFRKTNFITNWFFGAEREEDKLLLQQILQDTDPDFLRWALKIISKWDNISNPENFVHIHGTSDKILPFRNIKDPIAINGGGHLMTLTHAVQISKIIQRMLDA